MSESRCDHVTAGGAPCRCEELAMGGVTPPPDPGRTVAEARAKVIAKGMFRNGYIQKLAEIHLKEFEAAVRADERARLLSGQQDADAHGEALRRHQAGA